MIHIVSVGVLYIHTETGACGLNTLGFKCGELHRGNIMVPEVLLLPNHPCCEEKILQPIRSKHSLFLKLYFPIKQEYCYLNAILHALGLKLRDYKEVFLVEVIVGIAVKLKHVLEGW